MSLDDDEPGYEVGYGKPPREKRFRKGVSGNPRGRPKGSLNVASALERAMREKVSINENGQRKTITKLEAAAKQLVNKAASGDLAATKQLTALANSISNDSRTANGNETIEADQKIMKRMLERLHEAKKEIK